MKVAVAVVVCAVLAPSCQSSSSSENPQAAAPVSAESAPAVPTPAAEAAPTLPSDPRAADVDRICNSEQYSGALELEEGARAIHTGQWLALNLQTEEGRNLSATLARLPAAERIERLRAEATRNGVGDCALLRTWSGAPVSPAATSP